MTITDIVALAKAGYTPSQVKELIALDKEPEQKPEPESPKEPEPKPEPEAPKEPEPNPDIEKLEAEKAALEEQLRKAQESNIRKASTEPNPKSDAEQFADIFRDAFY